MARLFNGSSDVGVVTENSTLTSPTTSVTISAWVYITGTPQTWGAVIHKNYNTSAGSPYLTWEIGQSGASTRQMIFGVNTSAGTTLTSLTTALSLNTWYYLLGRWTSGEKTELIVYNADRTINQSVLSASTNTGSLNYGGGNLRFGKNENVGYFPMWLFRAQGWKVKLTDNEAKGSMNNAFINRSNSIFNIEFYGNESPEPDYSVNNNDVTLTGTSKPAGNPPAEMIENCL